MTPRRLGLSTVAALLLVLLTATGWPVAAPGAAPPATAIDPTRGSPGPCPDDTGVTVVVDFQQVGSGEVIVRCSPSAAGTGLDALRGAGFQVEGVRRWGDSFICRIEGAPAPAEALPVQGDDGYTEACIDTPPATAYWSYWHASNGGGWEYSQWGVKNRSPIEGGFEGWSFSLNARADSNPAPRYAPVREALPVDPTPTDPGASDPAPSGGGGAPGAGGGSGDTGSEDDSDQHGRGTGSGSAGGSGEAAGSARGGGSSSGDTGGGTDGGGDQPDGSEGSDSGAAGPAPLPRQPRDGADGSGTSDAADPSGPGSDTAAGTAPLEGAADGGDPSATTGDVPWSGGEHLAAAGADTDDEGPLGIPSGAWWTLLSVLALLTIGASAARRRSGRTT